MGRYSKLVIKFWIVMAVVGCGIFLFTEKTEKASVEKDIYFKGEKTGSFCYGLLKDDIIAKITLENIEEFCRMILPTADFKAICIFPFLDDDIQKGFVFIKAGDFGIHGHFGVFDRQTGAISKSDWECYYDILNKTIEKFEDES